MRAAALMDTLTEVFPLEKASCRLLDGTSYPDRIFHFSTSADGRHAYIIGQHDARLASMIGPMRAVYSCDLYRGTFALYDAFIQPAAHVKHFYATDSSAGALVCTDDHGSLFVHAVRIDHATRKLTGTALCLRRSIVFDDFWSTARTVDGIVVAILTGRRLFVYRINPRQSPDEVLLLHSDIADFRPSSLVGQPWTFGSKFYLFEHRPESYFGGWELSGRLLEFDMDTGDQRFIQTTPDVATSFPLNEFGSYPERIKHVERNGYLWTISENRCPATVALHRGLGDRCVVGVLDLRTMSWRQVRFDRRVNHDQIALDPTANGIAVVLEREFEPVSGIIRSCRILMMPTTSPLPLTILTYLSAIRANPSLRRVADQQLVAFGIPRQLL